MSKKNEKKNSLNQIQLPSVEILNRLAISENGFVFDPNSGHSFTVNQTGLEIIDLLKKGADVKKTIQVLQQDFDVAANTAERDLIEFVRTLRNWLGSA